MLDGKTPAEFAASLARYRGAVAASERARIKLAQADAIVAALEPWILKAMVGSQYEVSLQMNETVVRPPDASSTPELPK